jgi:hypothetical protein
MTNLLKELDKIQTVIYELKEGDDIYTAHTFKIAINLNDQWYYLDRVNSTFNSIQGPFPTLEELEEKCLKQKSVTKGLVRWLFK